MTFAALRALHAILGDALDDIEHIYVPTKDKASYASPPPSPLTSQAPLDFPSLDAPLDTTHPAEQLTAHPGVVQAINKIVAAAGQMAMTVQRPFYSLCDAAMGYNLSSCMRLLEASHTVEILREAGPNGIHVNLISQRNGVENGRLAHCLRLLATHHFISERSPNVFAINRVSSIIDSGKSFEDIRQWEKEGRLEMKYQDTNGIAAFVGMCTDELFKSSAYLTEAYLFGRDEPSRTPFGYAFETDVPFFAWLEGEGGDGRNGLKVNKDKLRVERFGKAMSGSASWEVPGAVFEGFDWCSLPQGSVIVDVGGGIGSSSMLLANTFCRPTDGKSRDSPLPSPPLSASDPHAQAAEDKDYDLGFKFIIQDRPVVVEMGERAWRSKCPELLDSGIAQFQVHDFFTPQPIRNAAVFFLRVILHDWPDALARSILLQLREAATPDTKLVLAEFVLPLACVDSNTADDGTSDLLADVEGAESTLSSAPLLANLGKASANAYWMDLTMQVTFNAQERTLRETAALALSAGWKVVKVTRSPGSLFGHIVAIPVSIPIQRRARAGSGSALLDVPPTAKARQTGELPAPRSKQDMNEIERASSRCGTPTFGSRTDLPSMQEAMVRFGGGIARSRVPGPALKVARTSPAGPGTLKQPAVIISSLNAPGKKKKPSPLSLSSPKPSSPSPLTSPSLSSPLQPMRRRQSLAQLRSPSQRGPASPVPLPRDRLAPPSPTSPRPMSSVQPPLSRRGSSTLPTHTPTHSITSVVSISPLPPASPLPGPRPRTLTRPKSLAHLYQTAQAQSSSPVRQTRSPVPPLPSIRLSPQRSVTYSPQVPSLSSPAPVRRSILRRASHAPAPQASSLRKRSGSTIGPPLGGVGASAGIQVGGAMSMGSLLRGASVRGSGGGTLNFEVTGTTGTRREELMPEPEPTVGVDAKVTVNVSTVAARIERGVLLRPSSP